MTRTNIYSQELDLNKESVQIVTDDKGHFGIRFYLQSAPSLHDDDKSATTK